MIGNMEKASKLATASKLANIYHDPRNPGSFSSKRNLYLATKPANTNVSKSQINDFAQQDIVFSLHAPARRRFQRNKYLATHPKEMAQCDLVDMQEFASQNNGYRYLLTVIDIFSKKAFVIPVKSKMGSEIASSFKKLFMTFLPSKIQTDRGTEFKNVHVQKVMDDHRVHLFFSLNSDIKCGIVERFNRTLKGRMFKYFSSRGSRKYIDILDHIVSAYNGAYHSTIKMSPNMVNEENTRQVFENIYGVSSSRELIVRTAQSSRLKEGDSVRTKYELKPMEKAFYPNWSDRIYKIVNIIRGMDKLMYKIADDTGSVLKRRFYQEELQKVHTDTGFRVEVLRVDKPNKRLRVRWLNHPELAPTWIPETDLL